MYMYHSFLIHASADGHLGCFQVLAVINSAVMNTAVLKRKKYLLSNIKNITRTVPQGLIIALIE